jgi:hypothetical protein
MESNFVLALKPLEARWPVHIAEFDALLLEPLVKLPQGLARSIYGSWSPRRGDEFEVPVKLIRERPSLLFLLVRPVVAPKNFG